MIFALQCLLILQLEIVFNSGLYMAFHRTEPFIITLSSSQHDLNNVERDVKHQIIMFNCDIFIWVPAYFTITTQIMLFFLSCFFFSQPKILILFILPQKHVVSTHQITTVNVGLGGSVGCAVRLVTRRSRVQPPPRSATFFHGD